MYTLLCLVLDIVLYHHLASQYSIIQVYCAHEFPARAPARAGLASVVPDVYIHIYIYIYIYICIHVYMYNMYVYIYIYIIRNSIICNMYNICLT